MKEIIRMLESYIDTLMMLSLMMGIVFEMPILCWLFAKFGFLSASFMRHYRRYAIVIILVIAAVITPTADIFTLILVTLPMYLLYEISILIVHRTINCLLGIPLCWLLSQCTYCIEWYDLHGTFAG